MNYLERKEKINYLLVLIKKDRLPTLKVIAGHFNCSKRTVERMITILRDEGHDIRYSRTRRKYFLADGSVNTGS